MSLSRETVYQALFGYLTPLLAPDAVAGPPTGDMANGVQAAPGSPTADRPFNLVSREVIEVQRVPPALQPVLFMDEAIEEYVSRGPGLVFSKWTVYLHIGCTSLPGTAAATVLNPLIDKVQAVLEPSPAQEYQNLGLGDVIERAQFSGLAIKNLGNNSTDPDARQAVAYVPFEIIFA